MNVYTEALEEKGNDGASNLVSIIANRNIDLERIEAYCVYFVRFGGNQEQVNEKIREGWEVFRIQTEAMFEGGVTTAFYLAKMAKT